MASAEATKYNTINIIEYECSWRLYKNALRVWVEIVWGRASTSPILIRFEKARACTTRQIYIIRVERELLAERGHTCERTRRTHRTRDERSGLATLSKLVEKMCSARAAIVCALIDFKTRSAHDWLFTIVGRPAFSLSLSPRSLCGNSENCRPQAQRAQPDARVE